MESSLLTLGNIGPAPQKSKESSHRMKKSPLFKGFFLILKCVCMQVCACMCVCVLLSGNEPMNAVVHMAEGQRHCSLLEKIL